MILLDLALAECLHLAFALDLHARTLRDQHGAALPDGLEQLRVMAWARAKCDTVRPDTTSLDELVELLHRRPVTKLLLTLDEVGEALGRSRRQVERYIEMSKLIAVRLGNGGGMRVRVSDLEAFVDALPPQQRRFRDRIETKTSSPHGVREQQARTPGGSPRRTASPVPRGAA